jgi:HSP20 family protein
MSSAMTTPSNGSSSNGQVSKNRAAVVSAVNPAIDVYENKDEFLITLDVPGARADSVRVELENGRLTISAHADAKVDSGPGGLDVTHRRAREYQRSFVVPDGVDGAAITAELSQGVLRVRLPKSEARKPRVIPVRASA